MAHSLRVGDRHGVEGKGVIAGRHHALNAARNRRMHLAGYTEVGTRHGVDDMYWGVSNPFMTTADAPNALSAHTRLQMPDHKPPDFRDADLAMSHFVHQVNNAGTDRTTWSSYLLNIPSVKRMMDAAAGQFTKQSLNQWASDTLRRYDTLKTRTILDSEINDRNYALFKPRTVQPEAYAHIGNFDEQNANADDATMQYITKNAAGARADELFNDQFGVNPGKAEYGSRYNVKSGRFDYITDHAPKRADVTARGNESLMNANVATRTGHHDPSWETHAVNAAINVPQINTLISGVRAANTKRRVGGKPAQTYGEFARTHPYRSHRR